MLPLILVAHDGMLCLVQVSFWDEIRPGKHGKVAVIRENAPLQILDGTGATVLPERPALYLQEVRNAL